MSRRSVWTYLIIAAVVVVVLANTLFVVDQREQAIVLRFGEPVRVINPPGKAGAGLNVKAPFLENVIRFDRRIVSLEAQQEELITSDQQRLVVDAFVRYRISDPLAFYRTLRDERTAGDRIERLVNSSLRQVLGAATQTQIIRERRPQLMIQTRNDVARRAQATGLGIQVIDVRIRRADLPEQNQSRVFNRMRTSREQVAARIRGEGEQQKREIIAEADREVTVTLAQAQEQGETIRGEGDAQRTRIFAQSSAGIRRSRPSGARCRLMSRASRRATRPWCCLQTARSSNTSSGARRGRASGRRAAARGPRAGRARCGCTARASPRSGRAGPGP